MFKSVERDERRQTGLPATGAHVFRYGIYYTPGPGTALSRFGRSWFGSANDGATLQAFSTAGLPGLTDPNVFPFPGRGAGLRAALFAPSVLRADVDPSRVRARLVNFAARRKAVETGPLTLAHSGRHLVLRPVETRPALDRLAAQCINAFESFTSKPDDVAPTHPHLNAYQRLLLKSFGHPNVMSAYRFSITLAGPLEPAQLERVSQALWPLIEELCLEGASVDGLSLFGGGGNEPLSHLGRYRLAG